MPTGVQAAIATAATPFFNPEAELTSTETALTFALSAPPRSRVPEALVSFSADHFRVSPASTSAADGCSVATVSVSKASETPKPVETLTSVNVNPSARALDRPFASTLLLATLNLPDPVITSAIDSESIVPANANA